MKDLIKDIKFINDSKEFKNKDVQIEQLITDFIKQDRSEQLILNGVVASLPTEQEICDKIKNDLLEINKDKPVPSYQKDLGYSNGFIQCYEWMTNKG